MKRTAMILALLFLLLSGSLFSQEAKPADDSLEFSPDGDGIQDLFVLKMNNMKECHVKITTLEGLVVFTADSKGDYDGGWDGTNKAGKAMKAGKYIYIINAIGLDDEKYDTKGTVKLIR